MTRHSTLPLLLALGFLSGCVMKSQYDATVTDQLKCSEALKGAASERDQLRSKFEDAKKQNSDLEVRNEELSTTNQMLAGKNSEFANKCIEANKEVVRTREEREQLNRDKALREKFSEDFGKAFKEEMDGGRIALLAHSEGPTAVIEDQVLFIAGRDQITTAGKKLIDKMTQFLFKAPEWKLSVEGHTDSSGLTGLLKKKYVSNWDWAAAKALKVVHQMGAAGIEGRRLSATGFGEFHPLATNANETGRTKNRRIELVFSPISPPTP